MVSPAFLGSVCRCLIHSMGKMIAVKSGDKHDFSCHIIRAIYTQRDVRPLWYIHYAALPFLSVISHDHCLHQMLQRRQQRWEVMSVRHSVLSRNYPSLTLVFWDLGLLCIQIALMLGHLLQPGCFCCCCKNVTENISNVVSSVLELLSLRLKDQ